MKSSVKTPRKVINIPKKPTVSASNFKVTNSRLVDGKFRNTNITSDSDDENSEDDFSEEDDVELLIEMATKMGLIDHTRDGHNVSKDPRNNVRIETSLYDKINETLNDIPIDAYIQRSIEKYLNSTLEKMKEPNAIQTLYKEKGTVWIRPREPAFIKIQSKVDAEEVFRPAVCVWIPHHPLFKKKKDCLMCPSLNCDGKIISIGFTDKFTYRKVIDVSNHFYIMTHTYRCSKDNTHVFHGCNKEINNQLHELSLRGYEVSHMMPNYGVSKTLEHIASVYRRNGLSDKVIINAIKDSHSEKMKMLQMRCESVLGKPLIN